MNIEIYSSKDKVEYDYYLKVGHDWYCDCANWSMNGELEFQPAKSLNMVVRQAPDGIAWVTFTGRDRLDYQGKVIRHKIYKITYEEFAKDTGIAVNPLSLLLLFNMVTGYN